MKGSIQSVLDFTKHSSLLSKENLASEADRLAGLGFSVNAFCSKQLSREESEIVRNRILALSLFSRNFTTSLEKICSDYLNGMTLVGTLGMQKIVPMRNSLTVQDLIDNGVKVWLLSQQS